MVAGVPAAAHQGFAEEARPGGKGGTWRMGGVASQRRHRLTETCRLQLDLDAGAATDLAKCIRH